MDDAVVRISLKDEVDTYGVNTAKRISDSAGITPPTPTSLSMPNYQAPQMQEYSASFTITDNILHEFNISLRDVTTALQDTTESFRDLIKDMRKKEEGGIFSYLYDTAKEAVSDWFKKTVSKTTDTIGDSIMEGLGLEGISESISGVAVRGIKSLFSDVVGEVDPKALLDNLFPDTKKSQAGRVPEYEKPPLAKIAPEQTQVPMAELADLAGGPSKISSALDAMRRTLGFGPTVKEVPTAKLDPKFYPQGATAGAPPSESTARALGRGTGQVVESAFNTGVSFAGEAGAAAAKAMPAVFKGVAGATKGIAEFGAGFVGAATNTTATAAAGATAMAAVPIAGAVIAAAEKIKSIASETMWVVSRAKEMIAKPDVDVSEAIGFIGEEATKASEHLGGFGTAVQFAGQTVTAFSHFVEGLSASARKYGEYDAGIATALAEAEVRQTIGDIQRAHQVSEDMGKFVLAKQDLQDKWEEIKINLMKELIPYVTKILEIINEVIIPAGGSIADAIKMLLTPLTAIPGVLGLMDSHFEEQNKPPATDPTDALFTPETHFKGLKAPGED